MPTTIMNEEAEDAVEVADGLKFKDLGVRESTLKALEKAGFLIPSPIQAQMIAQAIAGRDCLGNAPTGTGKTAAFLVP